jgi:hypothetical protein
MALAHRLSTYKIAAIRRFGKCIIPKKLNFSLLGG